MASMPMTTMKFGSSRARVCVREWVYEMRVHFHCFRLRFALEIIANSLYERQRYATGQMMKQQQQQHTASVLPSLDTCRALHFAHSTMCSRNLWMWRKISSHITSTATSLSHNALALILSVSACYAGQQIKENPIYFVWYKNGKKENSRKCIRKDKHTYWRTRTHIHTHTLTTTSLTSYVGIHITEIFFFIFDIGFGGILHFAINVNATTVWLCSEHALLRGWERRREEEDAKNRSTSFEFIVTRFNHISLYLALSFTTIIAISFASFLRSHYSGCDRCASWRICVFWTAQCVPLLHSSPLLPARHLSSCKTSNTKQIQIEEETIRKMYGNWAEKWHACEMADNETREQEYPPHTSLLASTTGAARPSAHPFARFIRSCTTRSDKRIHNTFASILSTGALRHTLPSSLAPTVSLLLLWLRFGSVH